MSATAAAGELPLFTHWYALVRWLLPTTEKFPRRVRFSFSARMDALALDILEDLTEARYSRQKLPILERAGRRLDRLRILLRLAHDLRLLSHDGYQHAARQIAIAGKMLGGWQKQQEGKP